VHHLELPAFLLDAVLALARFLEDVLGGLEVLLELVARLFQLEHLGLELGQGLVLLLVLALQLVQVAAQLALDLVALELLEQRLDLCIPGRGRRRAVDRTDVGFRPPRLCGSGSGAGTRTWRYSFHHDHWYKSIKTMAFRWMTRMASSRPWARR